MAIDFVFCIRSYGPDKRNIGRPEISVLKYFVPFDQYFKSVLSINHRDSKILRVVGKQYTTRHR